MILPYRARRRAVASLVATLAASSHVSAQTTYTWNGSTTAWLDPNNWVPNTAFPGTIGSTANTTNTDIADFSAVTSTNVSIGFASGNSILSLGAIDYSNMFSGNRVINNAGSTANGTLVLNGATVNGIANTLISLDGASNLTLAGNAVANRSMTIQLGITDGVIQVAAGRQLSSNVAITQAANGSRLTVTGGGTLFLSSTTSTFNGGITITGNSTLLVGINAQLGGNVANGTLGYIVLDNGNLHWRTTTGACIAASRGIAIGAGGGTITTTNIGNIAFAMPITDHVPGPGG